MATSIGRRYSSRNGVDSDEAEAEAWFLLVQYWTTTWLVKGPDKGCIVRSLYQGLTKYFKGMNKTRRALKWDQLTFDPIAINNLVDILEQHVDDPWAFTRYMIEGLNPEDLEFLQEGLKAGPEISIEFSRRLRSLGVAKSLGTFPIYGLKEMGDED
jgi:hypothetical protein